MYIKSKWIVNNLIKRAEFKKLMNRFNTLRHKFKCRYMSVIFHNIQGNKHGSMEGQLKITTPIKIIKTIKIKQDKQLSKKE